MELEQEEQLNGERPARQRSNARTKRRLYELLSEHLDCEAREYHEGWNDARVAKEAGCLQGNVVYVRIQAFCKLKTGANGGGNNQVGAEALADLEARNISAMHVQQLQIDVLKGQVAVLTEKLREGVMLLDDASVNADRKRIEALERQTEDLSGKINFASSQVKQLLTRHT